MMVIRIKNLESRIMVFVFSALFMILTSLFMIQPTFAQESTPSGSSLQPTTYNLPTTISPTSPQFTDLIMHNTLHTFSCLMVGGSIIGQPCLTYRVTQDAQGVIQGVPYLSGVNLSGGALGTATSMIDLLYLNPPVRTGEYLGSLGEQFGIVKEAHAQVSGSGASVLRPILSLWQVSRNITYVVMIIIFVIIGMMVMFRQRINPQTVITAQAALPGLIIGLILITFSYFLAALITDISFVGINIVGYYFSAAQSNAPPKLAQDIATENVGTIFSKFVGIITSGDISDAINSVLNSLDGGVQAWIKLFAGLIGFQTGSSIGGSLGSFIAVFLPTVLTGGPGFLVGVPLALLAPIVGGVATGLTLGVAAAGFPGETFGLVLYFVALAIMIYTMIKLLFKLINSYLNIIFLTITAPFHFMAASLPGRQSIATGWVLNMLCHVLAFPAVFAVFYFVAYLMGPTHGAGELFNITAQLNPVGNQTLPLFGGLSLNFIRILLVYGALLATPAIPDIICRTIGRVSQAGQLLGQEISGGTSSGRGYASQFGGRLGGTAGSLGKTFGGETQYRWDEATNSWEPFTGYPGVFGKRGILKGKI